MWQSESAIWIHTSLLLGFPSRLGHHRAFSSPPPCYTVGFHSVQFSHSVISDSSSPHGLQHARLPRPSPAPRACSNSCPSSWWCWVRFSLIVYFIAVVSIHQSQSPSSSHPIFSPWYPDVNSLYLCLYCCLANKFLCIIFLDSTYKWYYIFVFPKREIIKESRISRQCLCEYLSQAVLETQT